jgi:hypothetical protein
VSFFLPPTPYSQIVQLEHFFAYLMGIRFKPRIAAILSIVIMSVQCVIVTQGEHDQNRRYVSLLSSHSAQRVKFFISFTHHFIDIRFGFPLP